MYRQKIRFVAQIGDQRQLTLDAHAIFLRDAFGPAQARALFRELAQMAGRRFSLRYELVWIFVPQLIQ